ncbi:helix-turn-helix domain-containing protein [Tepidiforma flava]|uniref:Helix-turn-helix domain-containing protein n=1 Tax=Tepidiforma flava TaxID=3004094 RepID=A0ABY7MA48_9CHLR|nr:helix-turn-helix domain-containing protein [Tepidiforma flava]WBL36898.1 helix-turn-helix domain-containing protein [Tepidiforma flava]
MEERAVESLRGRDAWTAEEVLALRRRLGLSQAAMARRLGVRQQTVSDWETGLHRPRGASARLLRLLAEERAPYDAGDSP